MRESGRRPRRRPPPCYAASRSGCDSGWSSARAACTLAWAVTLPTPPRGVGGRRKGHPFRHPGLNLGPPVRTLQMVADDALQDLARLLRLGGHDLVARNGADELGQHLLLQKWRGRGGGRERG